MIERRLCRLAQPTRDCPGDGQPAMGHFEPDRRLDNAKGKK
jgi:hypothetical protein